MEYLHIRAPKGCWINDPNGLIYYHGQYHLFCQFFPYGPTWGTMHWRHFVSSDLIGWEDRGIALYPSKSYDRNGVFSGNALEVDGKLYLYYTGIRYPHPDPENVHVTADGDLEACQVLMISEDGIHFDNLQGKQVVVPVSGDYEQMCPKDTRDPKVWRQNGRFYMVLGSTYHGEGRVIFLTSLDGVNWEEKRQYHSPDFGTDFECPDLFALDGAQVMLCAATDYLQDGLAFPAQEIYHLVDFEPETCALKWQAGNLLDYGGDLYATQTGLDAEDNRILFAWMRMPVPVEDPAGDWSGMMTGPRLLHVRNGRLWMTVPPSVGTRFTETINPGALKNLSFAGCSLQIFGTDRWAGRSEDRSAQQDSGRNAGQGDLFASPVRILAEMGEGSQIQIGGYRIWAEKGCIHTDRSQVYPAGNYRLHCATPRLDTDYGSISLEIYVDGQIVELFANGGQAVISQIIYPNLAQNQ